MKFQKIDQKQVPQVVILVKLDNPSKSIYGGKAAAPVSKVVLQAAIAARDASLDRGTLAAAVKTTSANAAPAQATDPIVFSQPAAPAAVPYDVRLDEPREVSEVVVAKRSVPAVAGLSPELQAEMTIVEAGARADLGELDGALRTLESAPLRSRSRAEWVARLRYAYADLLLRAGRRDDAIEWFHRTAGVDANGVTEAVERLVELEGLTVTDTLDD